MELIKTYLPGFIICMLIAIPAWFLGQEFPIVGGAVIAMLLGMTIALFWNNKKAFEPGMRWTLKYILQTAVVLLGFGLNLGVVMKTGYSSLPIIICTISTSFIIAWLMQKILKIQGNTSILIGVGSSICGGSAIAAAAPVIKADSNEVAQSISVIFLFNILAAVLFPVLGRALGFSHDGPEAFGLFAGTAVNDTSSVTAAASAWDSMWNLGTGTLDYAVMVKLTRTLAIIPITFVLAWYCFRTQSGAGKAENQNRFSLKRSLPLFIIFFILAAGITTVCQSLGVTAESFAPLKNLSKFCIMMAMAAVGLSSNVINLIRTGGKPIIMGAACWIGITAVDLILQKTLNIW
ncbi:MAG: YeiH family protein [Succinivibrionaceae bacterium]